LNQCGHGGISFAPLTRGGIDKRRAGLLARGSSPVCRLPKDFTPQWHLAGARRLQSRGRLTHRRPDWVHRHVIPISSPRRFAPKRGTLPLWYAGCAQPRQGGLRPLRGGLRHSFCGDWRGSAQYHVDKSHDCPISCG
jgi:hypothetical protein